MGLILISESLDPTALQWLQGRAVCHYDPDLCRQPGKLVQFLPQASAWIVRNQTRVTAELLAVAVRLQVLGRLGVGLDNLDTAALAARRVTTVYTPGANANAVAELCLLFMLAQARHLLSADRSVRDGAWARQSLGGNELRGKTVGIIGLGAVGQRLYQLCRGLGCQLLVNTIGPSAEISVVTLPYLLSAADFISINVPLTPATHGLIGAPELALIQPHTYIINTARGEVVDEAALFLALQTRRIAGAALDVRTKEPPNADDPFRQLDNVILTPHLGGWTAEAQAAVCQLVVEDVWRVLQGEQPLHPVTGLDFVRELQATEVGG